jgi:hypothetical protein
VSRLCRLSLTGAPSLIEAHTGLNFRILLGTTTSSTNQVINQEVTGGLRGLQEIDVGFRFKFIVPGDVFTVPVAWIVWPTVQFRGLCAFLFPRTPPTTVLIRHGRELSGFKCIRLAFTSPMIAVIATSSPGWHQGAAEAAQ